MGFYDFVLSWCSSAGPGVYHWIKQRDVGWGKINVVCGNGEEEIWTIPPYF